VNFVRTKIEMGGPRLAVETWDSTDLNQ
jgi:hypothetical protein